MTYHNIFNRKCVCAPRLFKTAAALASLLILACLTLIGPGAADAAVPFMVKDIYPRSDPLWPYKSMAGVNGTLFFRGNDVTHGYELWKTDGTDAGTVMVKDINPGLANSGPLSLTEMNGALFFTASDGVHGTEIWTSDGTAAGTVMVKDICPGAAPSFISGFQKQPLLTNMNGTLYFNASDGVHGIELWASDGTAAGTAMVADINPGSGDSVPLLVSSTAGFRNITAVNNTLFFMANDGVHGVELWALPGQPAVTAVSSTAADGAYAAGAVIAITVTFSEPVTVDATGGTPSLTLNPGASYPMNYSSGSGTNTLTFTYTVVAGHSSADLEYVDAASLTLNGGAIHNLAGAAADLTLPTPGATGSLSANKAIVIDTAAPTVVSVTSTTLDGTYGDSDSINVTVTFSEPVTLAGGSLTVALDSGGSAVIVSLTDADTASVTYTVSLGHNSANLNSTGLTLAGGATLRDAAGNDATLTIPTGQSLKDSRDIVVATNASPVITQSDNVSVTMSEDGTPTAWAAPFLSATDAEGNPLTWSLDTDGTHGSATVSGSGASPSVLSYAPDANYAGPDSFIAQVSDGSSADTITVNVTIAAVNDAPAFTKGADQAVNEDAGAQTVSNWATAMSPGGGADEAGQSLTFTLTNTNTTLFATQPALSSAGTLTYTPAVNQHGSATVTVTLKDNGGTANGGEETSAAQTFTITVNALNDAPVNTTAPGVSGTSQVGETLSVSSDGAWNDALDQRDVRDHHRRVSMAARRRRQRDQCGRHCRSHEFDLHPDHRRCPQIRAGAGHGQR